MLRPYRSVEGKSRLVSTTPVRFTPLLQPLRASQCSRSNFHVAMACRSVNLPASLGPANDRIVKLERRVSEALEAAESDTADHGWGASGAEPASGPTRQRSKAKSMISAPRS